MTNTERNTLEKALKHIRRCDGNCKQCDHCQPVCSKSGLYYAFVCDVHHADEYFWVVADKMSDLKRSMIEAIEFELS